MCVCVYRVVSVNFAGGPFRESGWCCCIYAEGAVV